jgi:spermidine/putrescine transport system substrate-binding protein
MSLRHTLLATAIAACALPAYAADPEFTIFDWSGWENPDLMAEYSAKNNDMPTYSFFADDDEAFQKVSSGFKVDVVHPCSQMVPKYREAGLIEPWDVSKIPEFANVKPAFLESASFKDAEGVWFIPTDYAYTALAYNTNEVKAEEVASLNVFKDPKFAGRISLPDNTDDIWALALLATGVSDWTTVTDEQFAAGAAWLREVHPNVRTYWSDPAELAQSMASGEILLAWSWNDAVAIMKSEGFPVGFQRTATEGSSSFICGIVNMKDAPGNEEKAYDYANAFLSQKSAPVLLRDFGYASANDAGMAALPIEDLKAGDVDPIEGKLLAQTPLPAGMREKMLEEFEAIKAGF